MRALALSAVVALLLGCGGAAEPPAVAPAKPVAPAGPVQGGAVTSIPRAAVHAAVADGLGVLLSRVEIDAQPVMTGGKFHGFRISALRDPDFFVGVDLKAGDVVTSVNGFSIERPEQAQTALESLDVASELRVAYEREGQPRELVYAIVDAR